VRISLISHLTRVSTQKWAGSVVLLWFPRSVRPPDSLPNLEFRLEILVAESSVNGVRWKETDRRTSASSNQELTCAIPNSDKSTFHSVHSDRQNYIWERLTHDCLRWRRSAPCLGDENTEIKSCVLWCTVTSFCSSPANETVSKSSCVIENGVPHDFHALSSLGSSRQPPIAGVSASPICG
jgi:hypothetical protein